jgi:hypothetical protein
MSLVGGGGQERRFDSSLAWLPRARPIHGSVVPVCQSLAEPARACPLPKLPRAFHPTQKPRNQPQSPAANLLTCDCYRRLSLVFHWPRRLRSPLRCIAKHNYASPSFLPALSPLPSQWATVAANPPPPPTTSPVLVVCWAQPRHSRIARPSRRMSAPTPQLHDRLAVTDPGRLLPGLLRYVMILPG